MKSFNINFFYGNDNLQNLDDDNHLTVEHVVLHCKNLEGIANGGQGGHPLCLTDFQIVSCLKDEGNKTTFLDFIGWMLYGFVVTDVLFDGLKIIRYHFNRQKMEIGCILSLTDCRQFI